MRRPASRACESLSVPDTPSLSGLLRLSSPGQFVRFNFHNTRDTSLHLCSRGHVMTLISELLLVQLSQF